jgi:pyrrolidone-carboxylate peptidase
VRARTLPALLALLLLAALPAAHARTVEEARVPEALERMPDLRTPAEQATRDLAGGPLTAEAATAAGLELWRAARDAVQGGALDDRPLYWSRLAALREARSRCDAATACAGALAAWEHATRGVGDADFGEQEADLHVLVTGFDPFALDRRLDQSNPSGVAALALDDRVLTIGDRRVAVQALLFPVRFADFDDGLVETLIRPRLETGEVDLLLTVSMGRDAFDLERFPGRRRSATAPDNLGVRTGASPEDPRIPPLGAMPLPGPEFVEFSLPVAAMRTVTGPWPVHDNRRVTTLERGTFEAPSLAALAGQTAVRGSGGGYLSNEISFRTVRLARELAVDVPVGHLHTPRIEGHDPAVLAALVAQVEALVRAAAAAL